MDLRVSLKPQVFLLPARTPTQFSISEDVLIEAFLSEFKNDILSKKDRKLPVIYTNWTLFKVHLASTWLNPLLLPSELP